jgi:tetratricopeptide (TPR) repeat protein
MGIVFHDLGDHERSLKLLKEALALWEAQGLGQGFEATELQLYLAPKLVNFHELQAADERIAALLARLGKDPQFDQLFAVRIHLAQGHVLEEQGRFAEAALAFARAEEQYRLQPPDAELDLRLRMDKADNAMFLGRYEEARVLIDGILAEQADELARAKPTALNMLCSLGMIMIEQGDLAAAEELFLDLCEDARRSLEPEHPRLLMYRLNLARVWEAMGRHVDAEILYREILPLLEEQDGAMSQSVLMNRNNIASCLVWQGRIAEAEEIFYDVWQKNTQLWGQSHEATLSAQHNLAHVLGLLGQVEEALELQEGVVELTPPDHPNVGHRRNQLGTLRAQAGETQ